jgi:outer membrane protein OmpA-like peptidoglycan-associated protein
MKHFLLTFCICLGLSFAFAQGVPPGKYSTMDEKAVKHFESALKSYKAGNSKNALEELDKAEKRDANFSEVYELRADIYLEKRDFDKALEQYHKLFEHNPRPRWENFYTCGNMELAKGRYEDAKNHLEKFLTAPYVDPELEQVARKNLLNCDFAVEAMKHPVPFNPINMGPSINTEAHEYFPAMTADGKKFLFTRNFRINGGSQEDLYCSEKLDSIWQIAQPMSEINTPLNEGAPAFSANGKIMFFASCSDGHGGDRDYGPTRKGYGSCDIFYSVLSNGHWTRPENVGPPVCTSDWESQPSFSSDGKSLYFIRGHKFKDPNVKGTYFIYVSTLNDNGEFSVPVKLNDKINAPGRIESVFIHPDNMTLYFSSDALPGMGGLDLYMSKRQPDGDWGTPVNLGYPINTSADENSIMADANGKIAYFASERPGGYGGLDFYSFELPPNTRPEKFTYFKGKVYDAVTKKPLEASFELLDLAAQKPLYSALSERGTGEFFLTLTSNKDYMLNVSKPGYLFYSGNFSMTSASDKSRPFIMDVPLQPIDTGKIEPLKNVFFDTDKFDLRPQSKAELDKLASFLKTNKLLKIQLRGHTDDVGDKKKNLLLSQNRAKSVYEYLVNNGVEKERLSYHGFGDSMPIVKNDTPEHRQQNRRTEYKITSK